MNYVGGRPTEIRQEERPLSFFIAFPRFHTRVGRFAFASSSEGQHHVLQHAYSPSTPSTQGRKFSTRPALVTTFHDAAPTFTSTTLLVGDTIQITWSIPWTWP